MGRIGAPAPTVATYDALGLATDAEVAAAIAAAGVAPGYAEVTADQAGITVLADLTGLSAAITVAAGRRVRVTGHAAFKSNTADSQVLLKVYEGTTLLAGSQFDIPAIGQQATGEVIAVLTPAAGAHTYQLRASDVGGVVVIQLEADANYRSFILVEDIGPAA